jgi:hypothetical protein
LKPPAKARNPGLSCWIFLWKPENVDSAGNPREVLEELDRFADKYALERSTEHRYTQANKIDLDKLISLPAEVILLEFKSPYHESQTGPFYRCRAYRHVDVLVLQIEIARFKDWTGTFSEGWDTLSSALRGGFRATVLQAAQREALGLAVFYSAIADDDIDRYAEQVRWIADKGVPRRSVTDLGGPLWRIDRPVFTDCPGIPQSLWMLVAAEKAETLVNERFFHRSSIFVSLALALHKVDYERKRYETLKPSILDAKRQADLEQRVNSLFDNAKTQFELRSKEGIQFRNNLRTIGAKLAKYRRNVSRVKELYRTIEINRQNYTIRSVPLISASGEIEMKRTIDQERAAVTILELSNDKTDNDDEKRNEDDIFLRDLRNIVYDSRQLDADIDYAEVFADRMTASQRAAGDLLQIAGQHELGEIGHHLSIDSAAVVASVLAVIVVEAILKESKVDWVWWFLALTLVIGSFAAIQVFGRKSLDRFSVAMTIGLGGAALAESLMEPRTFGFLEQYSVWISEHVHLGISIGTGVALALVCWSLYPRFKKE